MVLRKLLGLFRREPRPAVVGLLHGLERVYFGITVRDEPLVREAMRVERTLAKLPKGTRIGIEISPRDLEDVLSSKAVPADLLSYAAWRARKLGHEPVPIESHAAYARHLAVIERLQRIQEAVESRAFFGRRYYTPGEQTLLRELVPRAYLYSRLRSIAMARRLLREGLPLAFIGDSHARDLEPALGRTHRFHPSPESERLRRGEAELQSPELQRLKQRLDAHTLKSLERFRKS